MPTSKPRITLTLEPDLYKTVKRFASLQNRSMSAVIGEILDAIHPPLSRTVTLLAAAREAPRQVRDGLRQVIEDLEIDIIEEHSQAQLQYLLARARARSEEGVNPRPSNTGVRSGKRNENG